MYRLLLTLVAVVFVFSPAAQAQFFDDFNGTELAPHWQIVPNPSVLEHHVSGGMLHVTNLPFPSNPKSPDNTAQLWAFYPAVADNFFARAIVGWDGTQIDRRLEFAVGIALPGTMASMIYQESAADGPRIGVFRGTGAPTYFPAPSPGMHEFALARQDGIMTAWLNGDFLMSFPAVTMAPAEFTRLHFSQLYPNQGMHPIHVDLVQIVPAPPGVIVSAIALWPLARRRRAS